MSDSFITESNCKIVDSNGVFAWSTCKICNSTTSKEWHEMNGYIVCDECFERESQE